MNELIEEFEALRERELNDEPMTKKDYERWAELSEIIAKGFAEEARKYDTP